MRRTSRHYYITIERTQGTHDLYIKARVGATPAEVAEAWNRKYPAKCIAVRDAGSHKLLWSANPA